MKEFFAKAYSALKNLFGGGQKPQPINIQTGVPTEILIVFMGIVVLLIMRK